VSHSHKSLVVVMESTDADVPTQSVGEGELCMETEPIRCKRRKEPIDVFNGIFLKTVHFLNIELKKCVIVGIFKNRGNSLGILFKGPKGSVYWSLDTYKQFSEHFDAISSALNTCSKLYLHLDSGEVIRYKKVFGKPCLFLYDGERTLTLEQTEWSRFVDYCPAINAIINDLFYNEPLIQEYINNINSGLEGVAKPVQLPNLVADRLLVELRIANGGS
jgi:hypothetical protein